MTERERETLTEEIENIRRSADATAIAVAVHDYETDASYDHQGDRWFHAASTVKVPVLLGVFAAIEDGEIELRSRVHVRNRFLSVADGSQYRVETVRDAGSGVHAQIGKTMRVEDLAREMIVTSSNLATNLLVDLVGVRVLQEKLARIGVSGVELRRGVEDELAFREGINNRVTAVGLIGVMRMIEEGTLSATASRKMLEILHGQEFRRGIPAGLPDDARVAHKTGEISTVAHDVGLVYLPGRRPYALAILTEWDPSDRGGRSETIAALSRALYVRLAGADDV